MFSNKKLFLAILLSLTFLISTAIAQEDVEGSKDHPMISRYEGSVIKGYGHFDYDRLILPKGIKDFERNREVEELPVEGEITRILYVAPEGLSALQIHRNYQLALKDAGFEVIFECIDRGDERCLKLFYSPYLDPIGDTELEAFIGEDDCYFLARLADPQGDIYVSAHTRLSTHKWEKYPITGLQIVEEKPMDTGKVTVNINAEAMAKDLNETGKALLYGIHFDTDKATIKPKSESTLSEIATLLNQNPNLKLGVVGHTDATGSFAHNMELSQNRADAVVKYLTTNHGIAANRLESHGVASLVPVAANDTEEGRSLNRRVELVKIYEE
jgi:OmpA-OmpF porin, OOP family